MSDHSFIFNLSFPLVTYLILYSKKRFKNQDVAQKFTNVFDPNLIRGCKNADAATQCFNNHCLDTKTPDTKTKTELIPGKMVPLKNQESAGK